MSSTPPPESSMVELDAAGFDPKAYIRTHYASTSFGQYTNTELLAIDDMEQEADLAIKFLVQSHLATFIECKDAMDALYEKEEELFVGDALDPTKDQFRGALETVVGTTEPLVRIFGRMQSVDGQQETLSKLVSILRVPGLLYQSCGCTVAEQEEGLFEGSDDDASERSEGASKPSGRGARHAPSNDTPVEWWCGVPLVRHGGPLVATDPASFASLEFDVGVQALRSAIKFLEEHHDMVTGTTNDQSADNPDEGKHGDVSHRTTPGATPSRATTPAATPTAASERPLPAPLGATRGNNKTSRFTYGYAHALLCASLYLCDTVYKALYAADTADAVRVENLLELLLEATIASTRLRHFCAVVREQLLETTATGHALHGLERALGEHEDEDDARSSEAGGAEPSEINTVRSGHSDQSAPAGARPSKASDEGDETLGGAGGATDGSLGERQQHPVQAFLEATRHHHSAAMLRFAEIWARDGARVTVASESARRREAAGASESPNASRMPHLGATVHAYAIGGLGDSFAAAQSQPTLQPRPLQAPKKGAALDGTDDDNATLMGTISIDDADATLSSIATTSHSTADAATLAYIREQQPDYLQQETLPGSPTTVHRSSRRFVERNVLLGGALQLRPVIEGSSDALLDRALNLARRVEARSSALQQILVQCDAVQTPLLGFVQSILSDLEHRVSSYWRGVGAAVHSGNFDVPLVDGDPLTQAIRGRGLVQQGALMDPRRAPSNHGADGNVPEDMVVSQLPGLRFVPLVPNEPGAAAGGEPTKPSDAPKVLLPHSVHCLQRMISSAADIVQRAVRAFGRHVSSSGWLLSLLSDDVGGGHGAAGSTTTAASLDIACCVAVEVVLSHMESLFAVVQQTVMRIKTSIAETARQDLVTTDGHLQSITALLTAAEEARATMQRSMLFVCELVVKTFLLSDIAVVCAEPGSAGDVVARLTRQYVSTSIPTKCFNVLLVMVERLGGLFQRADDEVHRGLELMFSHPPTQQPMASAPEGRTAGKHRGRRGRRGVDAVPSATTHARPAAADDPVALAVYQFNAQLVLANIARTEEIVQVMCANAIVASIDGCHLRCHRLGSGSAPSSSAQPRRRTSAVPIEVECLADLQCLARVLPAVVADHILVPTLFTVCSTLAQPAPTTAAPAGPSSTSKATANAVLAAAKEKGAAFGAQFAPLFEEMAFVAMESILARMVSDAQAEVCHCIATGGFVAPGMDWSDYGPAGGPGSYLSDPVAAPPIRVRHYLVDCLVVAARLQEAMTALNVPAIAFAGVLRIGACIATSLVSAFQCNASSCFEMPSASAQTFYVYGLLLLEAEARYCISALTSLVEASLPIQAASSSNADAARVQAAAAEVATGIELVEALAKQLHTIGAQACEQIAASKKLASDVPDLLVPTPAERGAWLDAAVHLALACSSLVIDALCSYVDAASTSAAAPKAMSTAFAERIQQRSAKVAPRGDTVSADASPHASRLKNRFASGAAASHSKSPPHVQIKEPRADDEATGNEDHHQPPVVVQRALRKKKQQHSKEPHVDEPPTTKRKKRAPKSTDEPQAPTKPKRDRFKR